MALLIDKYRPTNADQLDFNVPLAKRLQKMASEGDFPHLLFYGPPGCGKKTRVMVLLRSVFGPSIDKLVVETRQLKKGTSSSTFEITLISSPHHIEVSPSDAGSADRFVVMELIKEVAQSLPLDVTESTGSQGLFSSMPAEKDKNAMEIDGSDKSSSSTTTTTDSKGLFKIVILSGADLLSKQAQHALRRTMEKYMATCRLILICESTSKIIPPLISRCLLIRCSAPTDEEIVSILQKVGESEFGGGSSSFSSSSTKGVPAVSPELAKNIARQSEGNLRRALLMLDACRAVKGGSPSASSSRGGSSGIVLEGSMMIPVPDWEVAVEDIAKSIAAEQSAKQVLEVRKKLYELLVNCIPADVIMQRLSSKLWELSDGSIKDQIAYWAGFFEHRCQLGTKPIIHIEAFITKYMAIQKAFLLGAFPRRTIDHPASDSFTSSPSSLLS
ncbi:Replication factor C subunit 3, RFC3 [Monocercomonoides exilis]|uniref:Replication factor C subunit 3, RFC3 n=1 Tax=Monocercomonoides exilis TaxID=2049356 RepID=UPI0035596D0A|nr:Replication factor C subunit 3, RFC3 [Monocercomonoides exilis]|eukprot:MONOS_12476.1-p1 / transcript=MONOS_12476.1 / gene=MONOS_12476 / organism=Monocercomonoides_exilis_PA203 / gene_product=Replication factor C subunit 3, RFC3 / transcript_product=Replication factor C subunit 3, RFC3 / location=Mono_scaffold00694:1984-3670(+) / protein_length=443 / sequence_SO=supercontig / SO=protein_coding / is_pseudo=false